MDGEKILSVIIPVYNERDTVERVIEKVRGCGIRTEIIIVDDCSTDGTRELLKGKLKNRVDKVLYHKKNYGKGVAPFAPTLAELTKLLSVFFTFFNKSVFRQL